MAAVLCPSRRRASMNLGAQRLFHPPLGDHEAAVLENAVRLAVDSVINVLCSVNGARSREHRRAVEEREREIRRLQARVTELERELRLRRRRGCSCGPHEARSPAGRPGAASPGAAGPGGSDPDGSEPDCGDPDCRDRDCRDRDCGDPDCGDRDCGDPDCRDPDCRDRDCGDPDAAAGQQECEMRISLGLFAGPPSLESAVPSSPGHLVLDPSSEASGGPDACGGVVKEEACDLDAVLIKWEMSEETVAAGGLRGQDAGSPSPGSIPRGKSRQKPQADPGGAQTAEGDQLRMKRRSVPMSQLPEEAQRIKRAAWRAASRRYYARKVARQQATPARPGAFPRLLACPFSQPPPPPPPDSWSSSSRRFYSQEPPPPYGVLLDGAEPPADTQDAGGGGIMCS